MDITEAEKVKKKAEKKIQVLTEKHNLNPNILKYFQDGEIYYSYLTCGGLIGSIDTVSYDARYEKAIKEFEKKHKGCMVYHAVLTGTDFGDILSLLFVEDEASNCKADVRLSDNYIYAYNVNLTYPQASQFGYIVVSEFEGSGALIRIG